MPEETTEARRPPRRSKRFYALLLALLVLCGALLAEWAGGKGNGEAAGPKKAPSQPLTFDGETTALPRTQVVPTLTSTMEDGKNVIWCASFLAGWKRLEADLLKGPVQLKGAATECARLTQAPDPANDMTGSSFYAVAGMENKGILDTIRQTLAQRFPDKPPPDFSQVWPGSFVFYTYLETSVPFDIPYFDNREPLAFADAGGKVTPVHSFGIREEDCDRYGNLRNQLQVLYAKRDAQWEAQEFAVDLCKTSQPDQVVVAKIRRRETLQETLDALETAMEEQAKAEMPDYFAGNDILLVPEMFWHLVHHFSEFERKRFLNPSLSAQSMDIAVQDIQFRLDRSGAELGSEAYSHWACAGQAHFVLDGPFLLYLRKRGVPRPYFVMWVENAELLREWEESSQ